MPSPHLEVMYFFFTKWITHTFILTTLERFLALILTVEGRFGAHEALQYHSPHTFRVV